MFQEVLGSGFTGFRMGVHAWRCPMPALSAYKTDHKQSKRCRLSGSLFGQDFRNLTALQLNPRPVIGLGIKSAWKLGLYLHEALAHTPP